MPPAIRPAGGQSNEPSPEPVAATGAGSGAGGTIGFGSSGQVGSPAGAVELRGPFADSERRSEPDVAGAFCTLKSDTIGLFAPAVASVYSPVTWFTS